jgi:predicted small lipoprotein YifL
MKKSMAFVLILMMIFSMTGCGGSAPEQAAEPSEQNASPAETPTGSAYKIGVMTGTVSQNEEEYRAAENMQALYGDMIEISTYPDRFMQEQETTITNMMAMASDPDLKAIVMVQAVPGAAAAIARVREVRPEMMFILGTPGEDPDVIAAYGDVIMQIDELARGPQTARQAKEMGAETLVHYSFPRHMSYEMLATRRDLMKEEAERIGLRFIEEDAPDPTSDAGVPGTQQFIMEDLPRKVAEYGTDTAFLRHQLCHDGAVDPPDNGNWGYFRRTVLPVSLSCIACGTGHWCSGR